MISEHISLKEAIFSQTAIRHGIDNMPNEDALANMRIVARLVFEPVRNHFKIPIKISSFYRCKELNIKIGGAINSQHVKGMAIDMQSMSDEVSNADIFNYIKDNLTFDQLIWEFGDDKNPAWVHVSYNSFNNRKQVLKVK